ncbi:DUF2180 family protein [uncultured Brachybacterium sp.]|uniref:DUF2180 family protein n=1 Tax=uncultured Brachybacterium sp. TaxID=189680 RepID=UPI003427A489
MNCWEHSKSRPGVEPAVAVCVHCGAALCTEHASVCEQKETRSNGPGAPSQLSNTRRICCNMCSHRSRVDQDADALATC